jgi:hypothetical protein
MWIISCVPSKYPDLKLIFFFCSSKKNSNGVYDHAFPWEFTDQFAALVMHNPAICYGFRNQIVQRLERIKAFSYTKQSL